MTGAANRLKLTPADHARMLHPSGRRGVVTIAQRGETWVERACSRTELPDIASKLAGESDVYLSQQSFYGWRRIAHLAELGAVYSDIDYHATAWAAGAPEHVAHAVLRSLQDAGVPAPSYILATGRGLVAVWLHELVPRAALPRWMAVQKRLHDILRPWGADPRALDAARVFRLAGTKHGGVDAIVRPVWLAASIDKMWRWDFEDLAREVLPRGRAEVVVLGVRRAERSARGQAPAPTQRLTAASYWEAVLTDLQCLLQFRWSGRLPPGQRDTWLFVACNAMTWLAPAAALRREFHALADQVAGWDNRESDSRMASIFRRAECAARGESIEWGGQRVDPRYRIKAETIVNWLSITQPEMRGAGLRVLVDDEVSRERATARQTASRRRQGTPDRRTYLADKSSLALERSAMACLLRNEGRNWTQVAEEMALPGPEAARKLAARGSSRHGGHSA
jgi:hypothetical protein